MMLKFCGDYMRFCLALFEVRLQGPKEVGLLPERGFRNPKNRQIIRLRSSRSKDYFVGFRAYELGNRLPRAVPRLLRAPSFFIKSASVPKPARRRGRILRPKRR